VNINSNAPIVIAYVLLSGSVWAQDANPQVKTDNGVKMDNGGQFGFDSSRSVEGTLAAISVKRRSNPWMCRRTGQSQHRAGVAELQFGLRCLRR
jgi:hypothetical protein